LIQRVEPLEVQVTPIHDVEGASLDEQQVQHIRAFPEKAESMDSHSIASQIQGSDWQEASMDGKALFGRFAQTSG
jgi:hypothetical protein